MAEELDDFFSGRRMRGRKKEHESAVERPAVLPDEKMQHGLARAWLLREAPRDLPRDPARRARRAR
jgi:hypothetical protein